MPKAKPVSLHPLSFEEALKAVILADPKKSDANQKRKNSRSKKKQAK